MWSYMETRPLLPAPLLSVCLKTMGWEKWCGFRVPGWVRHPCLWGSSICQAGGEGGRQWQRAFWALWPWAVLNQNTHLDWGFLLVLSVIVFGVLAAGLWQKRDSCYKVSLSWAAFPRTQHRQRGVRDDHSLKHEQLPFPPACSIFLTSSAPFHIHFYLRFYKAQ